MRKLIYFRDKKGMPQSPLFAAILIAIAIFAITGCTTNGVYDAQKTWLLVGTVVVGGVAASQSSDSTPENCYMVVGPNGGHQVCDR